MEQCSETLAYKIQMPGNYPDKSIQHSEQSKSLKSIIIQLCLIEVMERRHKETQFKQENPTNTVLC
jgi:hypothetical protein